MSSKGRPDHVPGIVAYLKKRLTENKVQTPDIGIICGSGLGGLAATLSNQYVVPYEDIKGFPQSTVAGHVSELVFGTLGGKNVVCMKGRFHYYEGYEPWQVGLPVRVMAALGIKVLIVTNAAGGVNPGYHIGDLMIIKDQICAPGLSGNHPLVGHNDERFGVRFPAVSPIFDSELMQLVETSHAKIESKMRLHRGVYFGVSGPSYETPHEIGMIRILKGDSVGMSTVFEILTAAHCGIKLLGLSLITNRCLGPDDNWPAPTHEEVLDSVKKAGTNIQALVSEVVTAMNTDKLPRTKGYDFFQKPPADQSTASLHGRVVDLESLGSSSTNQQASHVSSDVKDGKRSGQGSSSEGGCCGNSGGCGSSNTKKESCGDKQGCGAKCGDESGSGCCKKKKRCGDGGCGNKKRCGGGFHKGHCCPYKNPGKFAAAVAVVAVSTWLLRCAFKGNCNKGSCGK